MWFTKEVDKLHYIEVEKNSKLPELTGDLKESLRALALSPAFQYLLARFRHKRLSLNNALQEGLQMTETQIRFLQAGVYWAGELERDITTLTQTVPTKRAPTDQEAELFAKVRSNLDLVGA